MWRGEDRAGLWMLRVIHDRAAQGSQVLTSAPSRSQVRGSSPVRPSHAEGTLGPHSFRACSPLMVEHPGVALAAASVSPDVADAEGADEAASDPLPEAGSRHPDTTSTTATSSAPSQHLAPGSSRIP